MDSYMEKICGSKLWGNTNTTEASDFTICFEYSLLIWIPCLFLWILTPSWIHMIRRPRNVTSKPKWLTYIKLILIILLIIIEITNLVIAIVKKAENKENVYPVSFITPSFLLFTYGLVIFLIFYELKYGLRSSVLLFIFWGLLLISSSFRFRTLIIEYQQKEGQVNSWDFISFYEYYGLLLLVFILTCFSERKTSEKDLKGNLKPYPESNASLISRITFWWINPLILTGYKKVLKKEDMWSLDESESCVYLTEKLEKEWLSKAEKYMQNTRTYYETHKNEAYTKSANNIEKSKGDIDKIEFKNPYKMPSLGWCLIKIFSGKFLAGAFMKLVQDLLTFVGPLVLNLLIKFTEDKSQDKIVGYFYTGLLFFSTIVQTFVLQHYFHRMFIIGARVRTSLMGLIYKKSLRLSSQARKQATVGEMVNLMQVNTQSFVELTTYLNMIWSAPLQITICIVMLWSYLGVASLAGLGIVLLIIPLNAFLSNKQKVLQTQKLKYQDQRIKLTNEILNGIKVLKFYGWEISFQNIVNKIRENELAVLLKMGVYQTVITFIFGAAFFMIATISFIVFILIDENNNLDAATAFVSLSVFNIIRFPLLILPNLISSMIQANVSLTRIRNFLLRDEIDDTQITHDKLKGTACLFENVDLGWDNDKKSLKNLNFSVKSGELIAVVGSVGAGKSSLLSGFLGEMYKFNGNINVHGSVAYVPQQAWIQNATLKNNILFGKPFNQVLYDKILDACALKTDLSILPAGDETEIGEKGINLSGGQKQRVSLARAVYTDADIYILDDPLSAVDAHVGKHIFDALIGPKGLLKNKTRVFATNSLNFLPECDRVIMLNDGSIQEIGKYEKLINSNGGFSDFVGNYLTNHESSKEAIKNISDEAEKNKKIESQTSQKAERQMSKTDKLKEQEIAKTGEKIIVKEKVEVGKVKFSVILDYFKSCTILFSGIFIIFYVLMNGAQAATSVWLSDWSDKSNNDTQFNKYERLGVYTALGISQYLFMLLADIAFLKALMRSSRFLHSSMLASILRSTMQFFESTPVGRIINRFSKDVEAVESLIPISYKMLIRCLFSVLITVVMICVSTPYFLIALVPISIIYVLVQRYYVAAMRQLRRLNSVSKSPIFSHFGESLTGVSTIRAYNAQNRFIKEMDDKIDENLIYYYPDTVSNRWLAIRLEFIGSLVTLFASLFAVIGRDDLTGGLAGLSISYSLSVSQTLNWLVRMSAEFESNITSVERIKEYCETEHEASWINQDSRPTPDWPQNGNVIFNNYSVRYRPELESVLKNLDCNILPREKIGIVGRTGAGKSSLTLALFRIIENSTGSIVIDDVDIKQIGLHDLRKKLTIIPQDPVLFSGTLRINLDPFEQYSDSQIWHALEHAHLKAFVEGLDKKLLFECSEGGENLSVGQRQLVCLARALLRKTKILILDEATASVDHNTDDLIQSTIRTEFADCTVITIAHRLNTVLDSTRIMVLDAGKIIEFDTPKNLLSNKNSVFYSMAASSGLV